MAHSSSVQHLFLILSALWRRYPSRVRRARLPRITAWAACAAALSLLLLPSCKDDEHRSDRNPRNGSREITVLPTNTVFYLGDWQKSPVVLADAKGQVVARTAYHPYGSVRNRVGQETDPWSFVGNEQDQDTGLGDFHARPYRAEIGMFLAPDPVGTFEVEKTLREPRRLFAYTYGAGDPPNRVDRDGRWFETIVDVGFIGYDVYRIVKDNVVDKKDNLGLNLLALGADVGCALAPVATGGGLAVRGGSKALGKGGGTVRYMYSGTKQTARAQIKAEQIGATKRGPSSATTVITKPEVSAPKPVSPSEAVDRWDSFLGQGEHTDLHPRTGMPDPNRIVSADGTRSIRYGNHEMHSSPTNHHYHEETWYHDPATDTMTVSNTRVRVPLEK